MTPPPLVLIITYSIRRFICMGYTFNEENFIMVQKTIVTDLKVKNAIKSSIKTLKLHTCYMKTTPPNQEDVAPVIQPTDIPQPIPQPSTSREEIPAPSSTTTATTGKKRQATKKKKSKEDTDDDLTVLAVGKDASTQTGWEPPTDEQSEHVERVRQELMCDMIKAEQFEDV